MFMGYVSQPDSQDRRCLLGIWRNGDIWPWGTKVPAPAFVCETSNWPSGQPGALSPVNLSRARAGVSGSLAATSSQDTREDLKVRLFPSLMDDRWPGRSSYARPSTGHTGQDSGNTRSLSSHTCVWSRVCPCADRYAYTYTQV